MEGWKRCEVQVVVACARSFEHGRRLVSHRRKVLNMGKEGVGRVGN
jgi:hypothetical protein